MTGGNNLFVDVDAAQIRLDFGPEFGAGGPFAEHLIVFNDLNFLGANSVLSGFTLDTTLVGMEASLISFTDHTLAVNYANLSYSGGEHLTIFLQTTAIPEPSSLVLVMATPLGMAICRRSNRRLSRRA